MKTTLSKDDDDNEEEEEEEEEGRKMDEKAQTYLSVPGCPWTNGRGLFRDVGKREDEGDNVEEKS